MLITEGSFGEARGCQGGKCKCSFWWFWGAPAFSPLRFWGDPLAKDREHFYIAPKPRRKLCGKSAQKSAEKSAHCTPKICAKICAVKKKSAQRSAQKSAHQNQHTKIVPRDRCEDSVSLKDESRKETKKKSAPNLCKTPAPTRLSCGRETVWEAF